MRKLIITALVTAGLLALVGATAIALLALPQDELMYAMNLDNPSAHAPGMPPRIAA